MWELHELKALKCLICILAVFESACFAENTVLTREKAINDLDYVVKKVTNLHPDPFKRTQKKNFESKLEKIKHGLPAQISRREFSLIVAEALALFGDDHTSVALYKSPDFEAFCNSGNGIFPLQMRFSNNQMVLQGWPNSTAENLEKGYVIKAVNDEPMEFLIKRYKDYISAKDINQQYLKLEKLFPIIYYLDKGPAENYKITFQEPKGGITEETFAPVKWNSSLFYFGTADQNELFKFQFYEKDKICLFKVQTFHEKTNGLIVKKLNEIFTQMSRKGTTILIIDLRGNGGGSSKPGWEILKRTLKKSARSASKYTKSTYFISQHPITKLIPAYENIIPNRDAWYGKLVLICDRFTASSAVDLAVIVKDNQAGFIAGEETGGPASYFGDIEWVNLTNSGFNCMVPTAYFLRPGGFDDNRGVLPDLQLDITNEDEILAKKIYDYVTKVTKQKQTLK